MNRPHTQRGSKQRGSKIGNTEVNWDKTGTIFDFKRFATGDGPGIRGLIFLKGCPLRCKWCANPESQKAGREIMYHREKCDGYGNCIEACPVDAIEESEQFDLVIDSEWCDICGDCVDACPTDALEIVGEEVTVRRLVDWVRNDRKFYENSGGGVTLTGGEPLFQCEFTRELLTGLSEYDIHTAIETTGFAQWECIESLLPYLNLIFNDFKHIDADKHKENTGVSNHRIKENLTRLAGEFTGEIIVRIPYIPEHNSSNEVIEGIVRFVGELGSPIKRIEIMPYHRLGVTKYRGTGRDYELKEIEPVNKGEIDDLTEIGKKYGVKMRIDAK